MTDFTPNITPEYAIWRPSPIPVYQVTPVTMPFLAHLVRGTIRHHDGPDLLTWTTLGYEQCARIGDWIVRHHDYRYYAYTDDGFRTIFRLIPTALVRDLIEDDDE